MPELGFVIETLPDGRRVKQRDNGLRGLAVADEALLWDAYQAVRHREDELYTANARLAEEAHQAQLEIADMRERTNEAVFDKFVIALEGTPEGQQKGLVCDLVLAMIARLKRELAEVRGQVEGEEGVEHFIMPDPRRGREGRGRR